ncbi:MAG TPA: GvpL/GvpF family gas vesicle protein [Gemmatimonadaceae bacterium]|nr:GvpL/GvpF family gas vesicle protein [Gemmatimonadaceae bacterium]
MTEDTTLRRDESAPPVGRKTVPVGLYVYCIIAASEPREFGNIGLGEGGARVYTVHHGGLAAVVSDTPLRVFDPTRENVLAHEFVNETVMREFTLIPMSFGTLFRTQDDIIELLKSTYDTFAGVLEKIRDKIEFGLKVLWDRERVIASLEQHDEEIARLREQISQGSQDSSYFARMQLGRRIEAAVEEAGNRYVRDILEALRDTAVASRSNKPIGERMIMNAAFLVDRQQERDFDERVKEISRKYEGLLTFKYTGPWPPYNFVNIKLKLEKAGG